MPYAALKLRPGIDVEQSEHLNEGGFSESMAVRFFEGLPQKLGGWQHLNSTLLTGTATGLHAWSDLSGNRYIAIGTEQRLEVFAGGTLGDITPIRLTSNNNPNFSTVINTPTVTIIDAASTTIAGDWINLIVPVSVGGLILLGFYRVVTVNSINSYTITAASNATSTVNNGGAVPLFTTVSGQSHVTVTLNNHGVGAGGTFTIQVSTTVGGLVLSGIYTVIGTPTTNTLVIDGGSNAGSSTSGSENSGHARVQYLISSGASSSFFASGGWGIGTWGAGTWGGSGVSTALTQLRLWFLDNFGQDMVGNYTASPIYVWVPPYSSTNPAVPIDTTNYPAARQPPTEVNISFVSAPQQMIIALGCDDANTAVFEPLLVRWCNVGDFTDWQASTTNQAGSYLIPSGSKLVGGISAPNFTVLWTDIDMWLMTYLGGTGAAGLVWGFHKITGEGADLLAPNACATYSNIVFFASSNGFYAFDGNSIHLIPCPVWDKFWFNLNRQQVAKVNCQVNSWFQEVSWAFPSATGDGTVDSRVTYNIRENCWTYDQAPTQTARTAWISDNVYGAPIGADSAGYLQQHETSNDADGSALLSSITTGWITISEGTLFSFIERLVGDFVLNGGDQTVQITVYVQDWPVDTVRTYGPFLWNPSSGPLYSIVRARGRYAQIKIASTGLGVFWRLGCLRFLTSQAGRR